MEVLNSWCGWLGNVCWWGKASKMSSLLRGCCLKTSLWFLSSACSCTCEYDSFAETAYQSLLLSGFKKFRRLRQLSAGSTSAVGHAFRCAHRGFTQPNKPPGLCLGGLFVTVILYMTSPCSFPLWGLPQFPSFTLLLPPHFLPFLCFIFLTELSFSNLPCPSSSPLLALLLSLALLWPSLCFHFSPFICFHVLIPLTKYDSGKGNAKKKAPAVSSWWAIFMMQKLGETRTRIQK